jgi:hypothetical protein
METAAAAETGGRAGIIVAEVLEIAVLDGAGAGSGACAQAGKTSAMVSNVSSQSDIANPKLQRFFSPPQSEQDTFGFVNVNILNARPLRPAHKLKNALVRSRPSG